jgi:hypothetical protein
VHKILCGIAKAQLAERVSNAEQSVPVLKVKENQGMSKTPVSPAIPDDALPF